VRTLERATREHALRELVGLFGAAIAPMHFGGFVWPAISATQDSISTFLITPLEHLERDLTVVIRTRCGNNARTTKASRVPSDFW